MCSCRDHCLGHAASGNRLKMETLADFSEHRIARYRSLFDVEIVLGRPRCSATIHGKQGQHPG
jgi:hypothetical protein